MILTDTHTHLYADAFAEDRSIMVKKAIDSGITRMFMPNIDSSSIPGMFALAKEFPENCFPMMGLHPCSVDSKFEEELRVVEHWLSKRTFFAIGEIGIDLYHDKSYKEQQQYAFEYQVKLAKKLRLPVVIHTRNAFEEAFEIISRNHDENLRGIFHCFSGNASEARRITELGTFKLGIGGVLTFKNSGVDTAITGIPLEHLVLETDAPYLAPVPFRGKRN